MKTASGHTKRPFLKNGTPKKRIIAFTTSSRKPESGHFNERTIQSPEYGHEEVRFTTKDGVLYIFVLNPKEGEIQLPSLGLNSEYCSKKISSVKMIGSNTKIEFKQSSEILTLYIPNKRPNKYVTVFRIEGLL